VLYWNYSGIDSASTSAGEVGNPQSDYPLALLTCVALITLTYMIPLACATIVNKPSYESWADGDFAVIAHDQVGRWLAGWVAVAGVIGNAGMHVAEMFEDSWQLHGIAEVGLAPKCFSYKHPRFQTPWPCIIVQIIIIIVLQAFEFNTIVCIDNFFSVIGVILEIVAFLHLRYTRPDLQRPYRVPVSSKTTLTIALIPVLILSGVVAIAGLLDSRASIIINTTVLVLGVVFSWVMLRCNTSYVPRTLQSETEAVEEEKDTLDYKQGSDDKQALDALLVSSSSTNMTPESIQPYAQLLESDAKQDRTSRDVAW